MSRFYLTVDGVEYRKLHVCSVKRSFAVLDGPNAGRVMDGAMQRDIIGTYYNYSMQIDPEESDPEEYDALYEVLSAPQNSHTVSLPYGRNLLTFEAYIANGDDELFDLSREKNRWNGLTVNFIAVSPQRRPV